MNLLDKVRILINSKQFKMMNALGSKLNWEYNYFGNYTLSVNDTMELSIYPDGACRFLLFDRGIEFEYEMPFIDARQLIKQELILKNFK